MFDNWDAGSAVNKKVRSLLEKEGFKETREGFAAKFFNNTTNEIYDAYAVVDYDNEGYEYLLIEFVNEYGKVVGIYTLDQFYADLYGYKVIRKLKRSDK